MPTVDIYIPSEEAWIFVASFTTLYFQTTQILSTYMLWLYTKQNV